MILTHLTRKIILQIGRYNNKSYDLHCSRIASDINCMYASCHKILKKLKDINLIVIRDAGRKKLISFTIEGIHVYRSLNYLKSAELE